MTVVGGVCHPDNVHFGLVAGVKLRYPFIKEGFLSAAVVKMGMCLMQEGVPKDKPSALDCVGHDEFHISDFAPSMNWLNNFLEDYQAPRADALQDLYDR